MTGIESSRFFGLSSTTSAFASLSFKLANEGISFENVKS